MNRSAWSRWVLPYLVAMVSVWVAQAGWQAPDRDWPVALGWLLIALAVGGLVWSVARFRQSLHEVGLWRQRHDANRNNANRNDAPTHDADRPAPSPEGETGEGITDQSAESHRRR